ncbi:hypothetical protein [Defluviimonas salinarum]|uniref:Uncharacterized protein n=1 Tax=Defluviimonas salinarum TaxID=2992147 RepID=A0ABT3J4G8_9RHOB|nr:hypothetical protein [Defluviimonas salinarum]MCW3782584.1 hypothetical protein [Defluviimonas salinarum]
MKRLTGPSLTLLAALIGSALPAQAGFYLEGLAPFAGRYCQDVDPTLHDPLVAAPAIDWSKDSADAASLGGRPAYTAPDCAPEGKYAPRAHPLKPAEAPQK